MSQATLAELADVRREDLDTLTDAERKAYVACWINGVGVCEQARLSSQSAGTLGNPLRRTEQEIES